MCVLTRAPGRDSLCNRVPVLCRPLAACLLKIKGYLTPHDRQRQIAHPSVCYILIPHPNDSTPHCPPAPSSSWLVLPGYNRRRSNALRQVPVHRLLPPKLAWAGASPSLLVHAKGQDRPINDVFRNRLPADLHIVRDRKQTHFLQHVL